jgi:multidrug efflux system membrane fusion protein
VKSRRLIPAIASGVIVAVIAGLFVMGPSPDQPVATAVAEERKVTELAEIEVTRVARQDLTLDIRVSGSLQPVRRTSLNAKVSGTLSELTVDVGDRVKIGDVIARFDATDLKTTLQEREATLSATQAQLQAAEATLKRTQSLSGSGISSQASLEQAESETLRLKAQLRALQAQVDASRKALGDAVVRAEFDGVISRRPVDQGQTVGINTEIVAVVDLSQLEVAAGVPTSRIADVRVGQPASLRIEGIPDRNFKAEVVRISPVADTSSRAVQVFLSIANRDDLLRGGMFASGAITARTSEDIIALPAAAIRKDGRGSFVLKVANGTLVRQDVTPGESWQDGTLVIIASGISEGDVVVTAPLPDLKPDTPIRIARL